MGRLSESPREINEIGKRGQAIVNFMHRRTDKPACQSQLVISSEVFFAGFELLTFVLKGIARRERRVHERSERFRSVKVGSSVISVWSPLDMSFTITNKDI